MWLSKFLNLKDDIKSLSSDIKAEILGVLKKDKLTPLEFTILEHIFNNRQISGYDLIKNLNEHFAGTWEAQSGTIYPILSKLKRNGFLETKTVKSPIGPLKKIYYLTKAGEQILKVKVNKNFLDQVKFMENFLIELASIYIHSFPEKEKDEKIQEVEELMKQTFDNLIEGIPLSVAFKIRCPQCNAELDRSNAAFCSICGASLKPLDTEDDSEFEPVEKINGE